MEQQVLSDLVSELRERAAEEQTRQASEAKAAMAELDPDYDSEADDWEPAPIDDAVFVVAAMAIIAEREAEAAKSPRAAENLTEEAAENAAEYVQRVRQRRMRDRFNPVATPRPTCPEASGSSFGRAAIERRGHGAGGTAHGRERRGGHRRASGARSRSGSCSDGGPGGEARLARLARAFGISPEHLRECPLCGAIAFEIDEWQRRELERRGWRDGGLCPLCTGRDRRADR